MKKLIMSIFTLASVGVCLSTTSALVNAAETNTNTFNVSNGEKKVVSVDMLNEEKIYGPVPLNGWGKGPGYTWYYNFPSNPYSKYGWWH